jgi:hypothetical protein
MNNRLCMSLCAYIPKSEGQEVIMMSVAYGSILMLAALNLAVNAAVGLLILLHCPYFVWPTTIKRPECLRDKPDLKTKEKGDKSNEQNLGWCIGGCFGSRHPGNLGGDQGPQEERQGNIMSQPEQMIISAAAVIALICLIGPSAVWRITMSLGEWLVVILVLICVM